MPAFPLRRRPPLPQSISIAGVNSGNARQYIGSESFAVYSNDIHNAWTWEASFARICQSNHSILSLNSRPPSMQILTDVFYAKNIWWYHEQLLFVGTLTYKFKGWQSNASPCAPEICICALKILCLGHCMHTLSSNILLPRALDFFRRLRETWRARESCFMLSSCVARPPTSDNYCYYSRAQRHPR